MVVHERSREGQGAQNGQHEQQHVRLHRVEDKLDRKPCRQPVLHLPLEHGQHLRERPKKDCRRHADDPHYEPPRSEGAFYVCLECVQSLFLTKQCTLS